MTTRISFLYWDITISYCLNCTDLLYDRRTLRHSLCVLYYEFTCWYKKGISSFQRTLVALLNRVCKENFTLGGWRHPLFILLQVCIGGRNKVEDLLSLQDRQHDCTNGHNRKHTHKNKSYPRFKMQACYMRMRGWCYETQLWLLPSRYGTILMFPRSLHENRYSYSPHSLGNTSALGASS